MSVLYFEDSKMLNRKAVRQVGRFMRYDVNILGAGK
jgi:hypothetical protein